MYYVVSARPAGGHRVWLRFEDGKAGIVDISKVVPFDGVFAPLRHLGYFKKLRLYSEGGGTIYWPNGADIDPEVLYAEVTAKPIQVNGRIAYRPVGARSESRKTAAGSRGSTRTNPISRRRIAS